jgi:hypothetical protein
MKDEMKQEAPVRRHVNISARSSAQLELRLHWFTRALAVRGGYILAMLRRSSGAGRHVATVAYELPLPKFTRPRRGAAAGDRAMGDRAIGEWPQRQAQGTSSGLV